MGIGLKIDVHGVRETLAELYKYERDVYRTITDDLKLSAKPAADAVGREFPSEPLANWHSTGGRRGNSRMPAYSGTSAKSGVGVVVSTRKPRGNNTHGLIRLQQKDAGGQVYDTAGSALKSGKTSAGQRFVSNLDKHLTTKSRTGRYRSRVMYPATKKNLPLIEKAVEISVRKVDAEVTRRLNG